MTVSFDLQSKLDTEKPIEEKEANLICNSSIQSPEPIKWFKNNDTNEIKNSTDLNITVFENILKFTRLNHTNHNGFYYCRIRLTNGQEFTSNSTQLVVNCKVFPLKPH